MQYENAFVNILAFGMPSLLHLKNFWRFLQQKTHTHISFSISSSKHSPCDILSLKKTFLLAAIRMGIVSPIHTKTYKIMMRFCETDYDECTSDPCLNGGTCINGKRKFTCLCPRTHKGRTCEGGFEFFI